MFRRPKREDAPDVPAAGRGSAYADGQDGEVDVRGGPAAPPGDPGGFFGTDPPAGEDPDQAAGGKMAQMTPDGEAGDVGDGPGDIRARYPDPDPDSQPDGGAGPEEPEQDDDVLAGMSRTDRPGRKKAKRPKAGSPAPVKQGKPAKAPMADFRDEAVRQAAFTCGCVTAGFCAVLLVIFGTVFVCRTFQAQPAPVLAAPAGSENVYYDAGGRMHVNVYMQKDPDTEITVYVLPDGTVTTEKPADSGGVRVVTMYVDEDGNVSQDPPEKKPDPEPEPDPGPEVPDSQVLYLDKNGQLVAEQPEEGPWRPITVITTADGQASVIPGEIQGAPEEPSEKPEEPEPVQPLVLYIMADGTVSTEDPGGDARKFTVDLDGDGGVRITQDEPVRQDPPEEAENPYEGKDEAGILAEAARRRKSGGPAFLDTDESYHIVWGDTLGELSKRLGFSVEFLAEYNLIKDKNLILAGEFLRYPGR